MSSGPSQTEHSKWMKSFASSVLAVAAGAAAAAGLYYVVSHWKNAKKGATSKAKGMEGSPRASHAYSLLSKEVHNKYVVGELLGEGTYAVVFSAALRKEISMYNEIDDDAKSGLGSEYRFAVKVLPRTVSYMGETRSFADGFLEKELDILKHVQHPNILTLEDSFCTVNALVLITERANGGDLFDAIHQHHNYDEIAARKIFRQLLEAIKYLHEEANVIHRDLKPENILLMDRSDDCANVRICDFGVSKMWDASLNDRSSNSVVRRVKPQLRTHTVTGTPGYQAPEILNKFKGYGTEVDLWSLGIILYTMLSGHLPSTIPPEMKGQDEEVWSHVSEEAKNLVRRLLSPVASRRPTASEALNSPWFNVEDSRKSTEQESLPIASASIHGGLSSGQPHNRSKELWNRVRERLKLKSKSMNLSKNRNLPRF